MKKWISALTIGSLWLSTAIANPNPPEVLETLAVIKRSIRMEVTDSTFIWNVQGYACQWPGIDVPRQSLGWYTALDHKMDGGHWASGIAMAVLNPDHKFCGIAGSTPEEVFGVVLVPGSQLDLPIEVRREIVLISNWDNTKTKMLRETILSRLGHRDIYSEALVSLEPEAE